MIVFIGRFKLFHTLRQDFHMRKNFIKNLDAKIIIGNFLYVVELIMFDDVYSFV
jgi:hypothetical protein